MADNKNPASLAASLLAQRRNALEKEALGDEKYSKVMSERAKRPRPNARKPRKNKAPKDTTQGVS